MCGMSRTNGSTQRIYRYYRCPHNPRDPRHNIAYPGHPLIMVAERLLTAAIGQFIEQRVFGPDRAAMLAAQLPATAADDAARRDAETAALRKRLAQLETSEKALMIELEQQGTDTSDAANAYRARIRERFTTIYNDRTAAENQLAALQATALQATALQATAPQATDPALLDDIPALAGLFSQAPDHIKTALYDALDIQILYRAEQNQATIWATLTDATPQTLTALPRRPPHRPRHTRSSHHPHRDVLRFGTRQYCAQILHEAEIHHVAIA
jgi:hypothetical protein